ncbi:hypothetical protein ADL19_03975 [Streptomyces purpurogeneiscleroticus]|nr:hypothetical protein ADL19_03975 [Streptomyces purpurogeneiscleroticus]
MKMLTLAAGLTALTLVGAAQAAPVPVQPSVDAARGGVIQVRDRSMEHGNMRGMSHGNKRGMRHSGMGRGNMGRGNMGHGNMGHGNMRGMNHRM